MAKKKVKKAAAKKPVAKKKPIIKKVETPVEETPIEEPQVDNTTEDLTGLTDLNEDQPEPEVQAEPEEVVAPIDPPKETWRDRVLSEAKDLKEKMTKLRTALDTAKVPASEIEILNEQYKAMHAYYIIINTRLSR